MKALIDPNHPVYDKNNNELGKRVCYFYDEVFDVAEPLFFVDDPAMDFSTDPIYFYYDMDQGKIIKIPDELFPIPHAALTPREDSAPIINRNIEEMIARQVQKKIDQLMNTTNNT